MEDIQYKGETGDIQATLVLPEGDKKVPGVIVVHEVWGLNDHIKAVAGRLGGAGFMTIAPDAFSPLGGSPEDPQKAFPMIREMDRQATVKNYIAAQKYLQSHPRSNGNVGIGTQSPDSLLNVGASTGADILLTREDAAVVNGEVLGRILFDATAGGVSTNEASAVIEAQATETQGASDKGGKLLFKVKENDTDSGGAAVLKMEINQDGVMMILENRLTDPAAPSTGQMWILFA